MPALIGNLLHVWTPASFTISMVHGIFFVVLTRTGAGIIFGLFYGKNFREIFTEKLCGPDAAVRQRSLAHAAEKGLTGCGLVTPCFIGVTADRFATS
jgi:hypothetical protein